MEVYQPPPPPFLRKEEEIVGQVFNQISEWINYIDTI